MFKLVREHIFEEFKEESDPISDMRIGLKQDFNSIELMAEWIVNHLPFILNVKKIPKDIIRSRKAFINEKYYPIIEKFMDLFLSVDGVKIKVGWKHEINRILQEKGYKE